MGVNIDHTFIQSKMLNKSKGPAVHSLRAQADKADYSARMRQVLQNTDHNPAPGRSYRTDGREQSDPWCENVFQVRNIMQKQSYCVQVLI